MDEPEIFLSFIGYHMTKRKHGFAANSEQFERKNNNKKHERLGKNKQDFFRVKSANVKESQDIDLKIPATEKNKVSSHINVKIFRLGLLK